MKIVSLMIFGYSDSKIFNGSKWNLMAIYHQLDMHMLLQLLIQS